MIIEVSKAFIDTIPIHIRRTITFGIVQGLPPDKRTKRFMGWVSKERMDRFCKAESWRAYEDPHNW